MSCAYDPPGGAIDIRQSEPAQVKKLTLTRPGPIEALFQFRGCVGITLTPAERSHHLVAGPIPYRMRSPLSILVVLGAILIGSSGHGGRDRVRLRRPEHHLGGVHAWRPLPDRPWGGVERRRAWGRRPQDEGRVGDHRLPALPGSAAPSFGATPSTRTPRAAAATAAPRTTPCSAAFPRRRRPPRAPTATPSWLPSSIDLRRETLWDDHPLGLN
jgi:hypothetical protein